MSVTIKEIAKKTGYSITTVSIVLNNKPSKIKQSTRDKIIAVAKELNYVSNSIAKGLVTQKTYNIAMLVPDISNPFYTEIYQRASLEALKQSYKLILLDAAYLMEEPQKMYAELANQNLDGILLVSSCIKNLKRSAINSLPLKRVYLDEEYENNFEDSIVANDNYYGGMLAASHLISMGHSNIGIITGPNTSQNASKRLNGFLVKCKERNIKIPKENIIEGNYSYDSGYLLSEYLILKNVSAIFCMNDLMAYGAIKKLTEYNISVPNDISIIGYDNLSMNKYFTPRLTSINQPREKIAKYATQQLINLIEKRHDDSNLIVIKPSIFIGETTKAFSK